MSVLIKNQGPHVEYVEVQSASGERDHVTVQPGGRVTLPPNWRVSNVGVELAHLHVEGNDATVSPLNIKE